MLDSNNNLNYKEAIIRTIAFFDIFDYPLTVKEVWYFSDTKMTLDQVQLGLNELNNDKKVELSSGYYCINMRSEIIKNRNRRYHYTERKLKRAIRITRMFKYIPWIEMVTVGNLIGSNNLKNGSDIDMFIVTEPNRIWLTRFFCVSLVKLLGLRPAPGNIQDKICLSFYMTNQDMSVKDLLLKTGKDYYFIYWLANLVLIYDKNDNYNKLLEDNKWLRTELPNWQPRIISQRRKVKKIKSIWFRDIVDMFFGGLEKPIGNWQKKKFPSVIKEKANKETNVVVNDHILKFHINDRREKYNDNFISKLRSIDV